MPTTPIVDLPYPTPGDPADVPADIEALAMMLDGLLGAPPPEVVPAGMELIWDSVDAGVELPVAGIETPAIPATFKHLLVAYKGQSSAPLAGAMGYLCIRLNRQTTGYYDQSLLGNASTPTAFSMSAQASLRAGLLCGAASGTYGSGGLILIPSYSDITKIGPVLALTGGFTGASNTNSWVAMVAGMYGASQQVIDRLSFWDQGGANFVAGTRLSLFGMV